MKVRGIPPGAFVPGAEGAATFKGRTRLAAFVLRARRVEPDGWPRLRELRLRALRSDPRAFGARLDEEEALPDDAWRERAAGGDERPYWIVEDESGRWVGMLGGRVHDEGMHEVVSMWVAPEARGRGAGRALVAEALAWARRRGATEVHLWYVDENVAARRLYEACGFACVGEPSRGRRDPSRSFQRMVATLADRFSG